MTDALIKASNIAVPVLGVAVAEGESRIDELAGPVRAAARAARFKGKQGDIALTSDSEGRLVHALVGLGDAPGSVEPWRTAAAKLPPGDYALETVPPVEPTDLAIAWAQGAYRFDRYKGSHRDGPARLLIPLGADPRRAARVAGACALARDMVNVPANDMGPAEIESVARELAATHGAEIEVVVGEALRGARYPAVYAVGRAAAADRAPRMIELSWGDPGSPILALVGKGVTFDTGGLDLKPSSGMRLMKKDMGGAAHALALARMVMEARLPVRLHLLIPAVENAVSGGAMRPGDVISSRKGLTIEIGNTDAEGRLILADALTRAAELSPDLTLDFATLTGAARVALGPEVAPFYTDDDGLAADIADASRTSEDPLWRMPLWAGYVNSVESDIADLKNDPDAWAQAGSVTAALFLKRFAPGTPWVHFDIYAWNPRNRPGRPIGAEAQAIRALERVLRKRFPGP